MTSTRLLACFRSSMKAATFPLISVTVGVSGFLFTAVAPLLPTGRIYGCIVNTYLCPNPCTM